jgi:hypothetical protein
MSPFAERCASSKSEVFGAAAPSPSGELDFSALSVTIPLNKSAKKN